MRDSDGGLGPPPASDGGGPLAMGIFPMAGDLGTPIIWPPCSRGSSSGRFVNHLVQHGSLTFCFSNEPDLHRVQTCGREQRI